MGFNLMYWTPMGGFYFLVGSILPFFRVDMAGLGKIPHGRIWPDTYIKITRI